MSKKARKIAIFLILAVLSISMILLTSCSKDDEPGQIPEAVDNTIDNVFFMQEDGKEYLFTITGNNFLFSGLDGDQRGTLTYDKDTGVLTLTFNDSTKTASATLDNNVLKLIYNGNSFNLVKREYFTVTYVDGANQLGTSAVLSSTSAQKPADPKKAGYAFIGWYADANFQTPFAFENTLISQNTTIYARFEEQPAGATEYTATLIDNGAVTTSIRTVNGVVYNLPTPEGADFVGWWVSDYQNSAKPTYQYTGQTLTQDTNLYAVYKTNCALQVSVSGTAISWNSQGPAVNYKVTVKKDDAVIAENSTGETSYAFDFSGQGAGNYTVTVTANGVSATAYYQNKALDRASGFRVVSSTVLVFSPVPNAQEYYITILCGNPNHTHTREKIGNSTNYNFVNCDMPEEGIRFVVTAVADGYLESVSDVFTYSKALNSVSGIAFNNQQITWFPVENATAYYVEISTDGTTFEKHYVTSGTAFGIADLNAGAVYAKVTPVSNGYYSAPAETVSYTKTSLAAPSGITVSGDSLMWNAVDGAVGYNVNIAGTVYSATSNSLKLADGMLVGGTSVYSVSVQAVGETAEANSAYSETATVNYMSMGSVSYYNGYVYWAPVVGASGYNISIGNRNYTADKNANRYAITFTEGGTNTISVCYLDTDGNASGKVSVDVTVYEIDFDARGGKATSSMFKAVGDNLVLPVTSRDGYDFAGWYTTPNALECNGKQFDATVLEGLGDRVVYAAWSSKKYEASLDAGDGEEPQKILATYGKINTVPVPAVPDNTKMFYGWYTEQNGAGTRFFDENGVELSKWNLTEDIVLYAYYPEILKFNLLGDGQSYSVEQGAFGIGTATEITIPDTYNDLPVTTVDAGAFTSCSTLEVINIPNSVQNIELGLQGTNSTGSAFQSCTKLRAINIYEVPNAIEPVYHSVDGVLYRSTEAAKEIVCYPYAKTGVLIIEEGTTLIPVSVFRYSKIIEVQIPYTVQAISTQAFYSCSSLERIVFLPTPEGVEEKPLTLSEKAIYSCSKLTSITFPARIADFQADYITSCSALTSVDISGNTGKYFSLGDANQKVVCTTDENGDTVLVFCPKGIAGSYTIPSGISVIGDSAFKSCSKIEELNIPGFVKEIRANAFASCSGITDLNFEEGGLPLTIRASAFYSCTGLTSLTLPSGLVKLEKNAFGATTKLTTVTIHAEGLPDADNDNKMVLDFATGAFASTASTPVYYITDVNIGANVPEFELVGVFGQKVSRVTVETGNKYYADVEGILFNADKTAILFYPSSRAGEYTMPESVTTIGANVFNGKTGLTKITIGKNITEIGDYAFKGCSKLEVLTFEAGGTAKLVIGNGAFYSCSSLTDLTLPVREGGLEIGNEAFRSCSKLTSIVIPEGVTKIGYATFSSCSKAETITLPSTLESLAMHPATSASSPDTFDVFAFCGALKEIRFSGENPNFTVIDGVLYKVAEGKATELIFCPQQKTGSAVVTVPGTVNRVYPEAFNNNKVLTEIIFADLEKGADITFGEKVFGNCAILTKITLPNGLTKIEKNMFYFCTSLEEVTIPNTVTSIENNAFYCCSKLSKVTFEAVETPSEDNALVIKDASSYTDSPFYGCRSLKSIVFPERMTELGKYAFGGYTYQGSTSFLPIESVSFPSTLTRIGDYAFYYAMNLNSVTFAPGTALKDVSATVFGIGNNAFYHTDSLQTFPFPEGGNYTVGSSAFASSGLTSIEIPASIKELKSSAFSSYSSKVTSLTFAEGANPKLNTYVFQYAKITSVILPDGITVIPDSAFASCSLLTSISIPATVTKIGGSAFSGCTALASVTFETDEKGFSQVANFGASCFSRTALTEFAFPTLAGTGTITLGKTMFSSCTALNTIGLSKSVPTIDGVLSGCFSISNFVVDDDSVNFSFDADAKILYNKERTAFRYICNGSISGEFTVPSTITELPDNIFESNIALTKIIIPTTVTKVGKYAFKNCYNLTEVVFEHSDETPSQLETFGDYAFQYCKTLHSVTLPGNLTKIPADAFEYCYELGHIDIPESVTEIGNYAFNQAGLTEVVIPCNVKTIGNYAFQGKTSGGTIASLTFAKNPITNECVLTTIGNVAFKYQKMASVEIPKSVTTLGNNAFSYNPNLTSFTFEEGIKLTKFGTDLVRNSDQLTTFTVPKSVTTLGNNDFANCSALQTVIFEEGSALTTFGTYTFQNCTALQSIHIPTKVTALGNYDFDGCSALESVTFDGTAVKTFGTYLFRNCVMLQSIAVPKNVTALGNYDFDGCTSLTEVTFDGTAIKTLGTYTFRGCTALESIVIPDSVTVIGTSATAAAQSSSVYTFQGCTALTSVTLGANTTLIGGHVFDGCTALESITIPKTVTQIGNYDFDGCTSLKEVIFESGTKIATIGSYAFRNTGLKSIKLPASVSKIDTYAFSDCAELALVEMEASSTVTTFGTYAFSNCTALATVNLAGRVTNIADNMFKGCSNLTNVSMEKVRSIGSNAFNGCWSLTQVELPDTLTSIGSQAFLNADLTSVSIPKSVISISTNVFAGCSNLARFEVDAENAKYTVKNGGLFDMEAMAFVSVPNTFSGIFHVTADTIPGPYSLNACHITELQIDEGITSLPDYAFFGATIDTVALPASLTEISTGMFQYARITAITIPANVTSIGNSAFRSSTTLKSITFEADSKLEELGTYVFADSGIESISLPKGITKLGSTEWLATYTFDGCKSLTSVAFEGELEALNPYAFRNCTALKTIVIPSTVKILGSYLFDGCSALESIVIPDGVEALYISSTYYTSTSSPSSGYTFRGCTSLTTVTLPASLKYINGYSFQGCTSLTSIIIPDSVQEIGTHAFEGCSSLATVTFGENSALELVGSYAFSASGIQNITISGDACSAATGIFKDCADLQSVTFTGGIKAIPQSAFTNCTSLESFVIPSSVTTMGKEAFMGSGLKSITIPASIETWNSSPFKDCLQLESVVFEEGCTTVTGSMFSGCTALNSVKLASTITIFSSSAFENCTALLELQMPANITTLSSAFGGWTSDQTIYFPVSADASAAWSSSWNNNCEANIVWNHTARKD